METITACQPSGKVWNDKPIYSIHLSDGRGGESFSQFAIGTPVSELEITNDPKYGLKFKKKQGANSFQGGGKKYGNESMALSYAKDLVVGGKVDIKAILTTADKLYAWMEGKKPAAPAQTAASLPDVKTGAGSQGTGSIDDLPF